MDQALLEHIHKIVKADRRYRAEAYSFIMEALAFTQKRFERERHVTGEELLVGIKELALKKFGPFALTIFHCWGIRSTEDMGSIVFNLVDSGILGKEEKDSIDSFLDGFDLEDTFCKGYRRQLERAARRIR
jgi:uncharacterized repeat protein (TIGR04138 family)